MKKEGRKKQARSNKQQCKATQAVTFPKKNELPQVGLEPTTLYTLDRALYQLRYMYMYTCMYICMYILQQTAQLHDEKVVCHEEVKGLPSPYFPGCLETTERGEQFDRVVVELLSLCAVGGWEGGREGGRVGRRNERVLLCLLQMYMYLCSFAFLLVCFFFCISL